MPPTLIHRGHESADFDDLGLELDDEEHASRGMPGQDVDDASFAIDRERHLGFGDPAVERGEQSGDRLLHRGVSSVEQSRDLGALVADVAVQASSHRSKDPSEPTKWDGGCAAAFDPADHGRGDLGASGKVGLTQALADADGTEGRPQSVVIHVDSMSGGDHRRLTGRTRWDGGRTRDGPEAVTA